MLRVVTVLALAALSLSGCPVVAPRPADAPPEADAGPPGPVDLATLAPDGWRYVPVPGAVCGNGSPAVIGVNRHPGATRLLLVIAGGGACWDEETCFVADTSVHVEEDYTRAMLTAEVATITSSGFDDRASPANPFRDANIVYVPYCTGDLHGGDAVQTYGGRTMHHRGGRNMALFLDAMREAWPALAAIDVLGFSAGGFGAQLNWGRFVSTWPGASLGILADCAAMAEPPADRYATWRAAWNLDTPADCTACATSFSAYDEHFDARYPDTRVALTITLRDEVLSQFWGAPDYETRVRDLLGLLADDQAIRYFALDSTQHVITGDAASLRASDGTLLADWIVAWFAGDARFRNVGP
jgi:hypothetical protein